jgi:regulator of sigma E protease
MMTLLAFIGAIALLVSFHEYGHYWMARRCGVKVLVFSLGMGPVLYRKRFANSDTEWVLSMVPVGGYVKMLDEREGEVKPDELEQAFNRRPVWQRMAVVAAGPLANFLLAILLYWVLFMHGVEGLKPVLGEVMPGTPAAIALMHQGDTIISINDSAIPTWQELRWELLNFALQKNEVNVAIKNSSGVISDHLLSLNILNTADLEGDFLDKLGLQLNQPQLFPVIGKLSDQGVAAKAGLRSGDLVLRVNGDIVTSWLALVAQVRDHAGRVLTLDIKRGDKELSINLIPLLVSENGKMVGKIGAGPKIDESAWQAMITTVHYNPLDALVQSLKKTWETSVITLKMMAKMVTGEISVKNLSGPVSIADYAGQSAHMGWAAYLGFLALISISLGVLNLLPVPLLDGGHLLYYVVELIKGSPVSEKILEIGQKVGIALLGTLMALAIYNDFNRLISG